MADIVETDRASEPLIDRLEDAAMVLASAPLTMDREAGEALSRDCDEGAQEIRRLRTQLAEAREALGGIVRDCERGATRSGMSPPGVRDIVSRARATLERIKEPK